MKKKFVLIIAVLLLVIVAGVFAEGTWSSWKSFGGGISAFILPYEI